MTKQRNVRYKQAMKWWRTYADRPHLPVPESVWYRKETPQGVRTSDMRLMYGHRPWRQ